MKKRLERIAKYLGDKGLYKEAHQMQKIATSPYFNIDLSPSPTAPYDDLDIPYKRAPDVYRLHTPLADFRASVPYGHWLNPRVPELPRIETPREAIGRKLGEKIAIATLQDVILFSHPDGVFGIWCKRPVNITTSQDEIRISFSVLFLNDRNLGAPAIMPGHPGGGENRARADTKVEIVAKYNGIILEIKVVLHGHISIPGEQKLQNVEGLTMLGLKSQNNYIQNTVYWGDILRFLSE